ncbi:hypothetical protein FMN50_20370 [Rhodobacterales bacterium]|nr:hypothetical protein FMN50_20370 [Rhodobacterales bacterium]
MPDDIDPTEFHRSMLDDVNWMAASYGWKGVTICEAGWNSETRILSITCRRGDAPATLHLYKKVIEAKRVTALQQAGEL